MSETKEKKDTYMVAWYVILVVMFVITVASMVFSDSIYGEDSVFNSAPTGIPAIDGAYQLIPAFIDCVKVVFIVYIIGKVVQIVLAKALSGSNKGITAAKLINSFIKYAVAIIAVLAVLSAAGVDTTTLVASAGILSLVIGLGAQSLIADIIAGLFTIFEGEYQVGDIVVVDGWRGTVEEIGIRSTRVVDAGGNTKIINNSEIKTVINQTQHLSVVSTTISIEYGENLPKVELIIRDNIDRIKASIPQIVEGPFYKGVTAPAVHVQLQGGGLLPRVQGHEQGAQAAVRRVRHQHPVPAGRRQPAGGVRQGLHVRLPGVGCQEVRRQAGRGVQGHRGAEQLTRPSGAAFRPGGPTIYPSLITPPGIVRDVWVLSGTAP